MKKREIINKVRGKRAIDGAGVKLVRVLGNETVEPYDPFLMLDSFDSTDPNDYTAGFPIHPHRGIETVTYLINGRIDHKDSLGNSGVIGGGECQWMTAGSGIMHEEMPKSSERMLGFQLWLNLPAKEKMCEPAYHALERDNIPKVSDNGAEVAVISGNYKGVQGFDPEHIKATILDVNLPKGQKFDLEMKGDTVFVFLISGDAIIGEERIGEKTAVLFGEGDFISVTAPEDGSSRFIYYCADALKESVAWGGPIVMNTQDELREAFSELRNGTFIKTK